MNPLVSPVSLALLCAGATAASAAPDRAPTLQLSAGLAVGHTSIGYPEADASGWGPGLVASAAWFAHPRLGLALDAWWVRPRLPACDADAACVNDRGEQQTVVSAGPRLQLSPGLHLQLGLGATHVTHAFDRSAWSFTQLGEVGWTFVRGAWALQVAVRGSHRRDQGASVQNVAPTVLAMRRW